MCCFWDCRLGNGAWLVVFIWLKCWMPYVGIELVFFCNFLVVNKVIIGPFDLGICFG